jgi:hypothetical protein
MGNFLILLLLAGIILVVTNQLTYNLPREIQYRYLPRDLDTYIRTEEFPSALFGSLWDAAGDIRRGGDGGANPPGIRQSN